MAKETIEILIDGGKSNTRTTSRSGNRSAGH